MKLLGLSILALACQAGISVAESLAREPHFWTPKNIYISVLVPGASHTTWVLQVGQELATRGHNVSFLCKDDGAKIAQSFSGINILPMGKPTPFHTDEDMKEFSARPQSDVASVKLHIKALNAGFREDFLKFGEYIQNSRPDLMLCDVLSDVCMRSAEKHGIPYVITSTSGAFAGIRPSLIIALCNRYLLTLVYDRFLCTICEFHIFRGTNFTASVNLDKVL